MRNRIRLSEGQLRRVIKESVYNVLNEISSELSTNEAANAAEEAMFKYRYSNCDKGKKKEYMQQANKFINYILNKHGLKLQDYLYFENGNTDPSDFSIGKLKAFDKIHSLIDKYDFENLLLFL